MLNIGGGPSTFSLKDLEKLMPRIYAYQAGKTE
jgi:hypothetical protein